MLNQQIGLTWVKVSCTLRNKVDQPEAGLNLVNTVKQFWNPANKVLFQKDLSVKNLLVFQTMGNTKVKENKGSIFRINKAENKQSFVFYSVHIDRDVLLQNTRFCLGRTQYSAPLLLRYLCCEQNTLNFIIQSVQNQGQ